MGGAEKGETMDGMLNKIKKKINTGKMWGKKYQVTREYFIPGIWRQGSYSRMPISPSSIKASL